MAHIEYLIDINLNQQRLLNTALQIVPTFPSNPTPVVGQILWNSALGSAYIYTGVANQPNTIDGWLNLGDVYTHPTYTETVQPLSATTGASVISQITLQNGHVTGVQTRTLTPANIGAATATHTHAFTEISGLPTQTLLGNNTAGTASAQAITVADLLVMLGIAYGNSTILTAGTDTLQRTWQAKDLNDWVNSKLSIYLTAVNLALGTRTGTTLPITNSAGTGVTLPIATTTLAGIMSAADKLKLDGIATNANNYVHPTVNPGVHPFSDNITSGVKVLSQILVNNEGHIVTIQGRDLTTADIASIMIDNGVNNSPNKTWSSSKIFSELQSAITAVKTGALVYKGEFNPATNTPNIASDTNVEQGWTYVVSASGTFYGDQVEAGDMIIAKINNPGNTIGNYQIVNKNIPTILEATELVKGIIQLATSAEAIAGTDTTKAITPATLKATLDSRVGGYTRRFGDGSATSFTITHGLNTDLVIAYIRYFTTKKPVIVDWYPSSPNTVIVNVNIAPALDALEIVIKK